MSLNVLDINDQEWALNIETILVCGAAFKDVIV
jgi:hypothetical protein